MAHPTERASASVLVWLSILLPRVLLVHHRGQYRGIGRAGGNLCRDGFRLLDIGARTQSGRAEVPMRERMRRVVDIAAPEAEAIGVRRLGDLLFRLIGDGRHGGA